MVYGRIIFNNVKEYTPSWIKTIPYSQVTKPTFVRKAQVVSKFNNDPKVKSFWRWFGRNVTDYPWLWQVWIFINGYVLFHLCYDPWLFIYRANNTERSIDFAIAKEKEWKKKKAAEEEQ